MRLRINAYVGLLIFSYECLFRPMIWFRILAHKMKSWKLSTILVALSLTSLLYQVVKTSVLLYYEILSIKSGFPLTPKRSCVRPKIMSKTSKCIGVIAVSNGLRPKLWVRIISPCCTFSFWSLTETPHKILWVCAMLFIATLRGSDMFIFRECTFTWVASLQWKSS